MSTTTQPQNAPCTQSPKKTAKHLLHGLFLLIFLGIGSFLLLLGIVLHGSQDTLQGNPEIMIILGCQVMPTGFPSQSLADRLDKALEYWQENPTITIIVSGGQGDNEPTTEAFAMANYLIQEGVDPQQIYQEGQSRNTHQNLSFSFFLMEELKEEGLISDVFGDILIVSSGFHLTRAQMLWVRVTGNTQNLSLLAAPVTHATSYLKSHIREPLALVKSFLFDKGIVALP